MSKSRGRGDEGAVLILALVFIIAVGLIVGALANLTMNDLNNTTVFNSVRAEQYAANSAVQVAVQSMRYTPLVGANQTLNAYPPSYCWGSSSPSTVTNVNGVSFTVWCSTVQDLASASTRTVTFYACDPSLSASQCAASPKLQAVVVYDDYPPGNNAPMTQSCSWSCGEGMTIQQWLWKG
jgi:hypothetical protein